MKNQFRPFQLLFFIFLITSSCLKKDEPFQYPDDPADVDPTWITETERSIQSNENWVPNQSAINCNPNLHVSNLARYELNYSRGFASIQLLPDSSSCELLVELKTNFSNDEISKHSWDENVFEFTYSEFEADSVVELRLSLYYKNLELDLDLAPVLRSEAESDVTNGLFKVYFEFENPVFEINGKRFSPDFGDGTGNYFSIDGAGEDSFFSLEMSAVGEEKFSFIQFNFLRILRFGLKDA